MGQEEVVQLLERLLDLTNECLANLPEDDERRK